MRKVTTSTEKLVSTKTDAIILPIAEGTKTLTGLLADFDTKLGGQIKALIKTKHLTGKLNQLISIPTHTTLKTNYLILLGTGKPKDFTKAKLTNSAGEISRALKGLKCKKAHWPITSFTKIDIQDQAQAIAEGFILGGYAFNALKSKTDDTPTLTTITLTITHLAKEKSATTKGIQTGSHIANGTNTARDLANTPANLMTPADVVKKAQQLFKTGPIIVDVIDATKAKKMGMNAFLGVGQGSVNKPYMLVLTYAPKAKEKPICLVGKGVTFDTGGISIKPSGKMSEMKGDMGGAAAVIGTMLAIKNIKPKQNVTAIIPLAENMPSATAQRPGDVVKAKNGKTVEILNTDAEGRLILADAICLATEKNPSQIIDIATLTGACLVALGDQASAILGNNQKLINAMSEVGNKTGDRVWQLPLYDEYLDQLKSDVADLANCYEGRLAGTCTAAKFLEQFVDETPWFHLDIASTMSYSKSSGYTVKGMTGSGTRNLTEYILAQ